MKGSRKVKTFATWGLLLAVCLFGLAFIGLAGAGTAGAIGAIGGTWGLAGLGLFGTIQAHGSNARFIFAKEAANKVNPTLLVDDCESAWTAGTASTTVTADTAIFKQGAKSAKMIEDVAGSADDILAYRNLGAAVNLSGYGSVGFWIYSTVTLASGDLVLLLDDTAACASPLETIDIPAVTAINTWTYVKCALATPSGDTAILSIGIKMHTDLGACTIYVDDFRALTRNAVVFPMISNNLGTSQARNKSQILAGDRNPRKSTAGAITGSGAIATELDPYMLEFWEQVMGQVATTDLTGSKYKHEFTIKNNPLPTCTGEVQMSDVTMFRIFKGLVADGFDLTVGATGVLQLATSWIPAQEDTDTLASTLDGSPTDHGHDPFDSFEIAAANLLVGGSANADVSDFTLSFKNNRTGKPVIGSAGVVDSLPGAIVDITGKLSFLLKSNTVYQAAKSQTVSSVKITAIKGTGDGTAGNEKIEFDLQELLYEVPAINITNAPTPLDVNYMAHYDTGSNHSALKVTVWNSQASV